MRVSRTTGAISGLAIIVLGVWGGLIAFVGPYFHYSFGSNVAWHYTANRLWLDILPGAAAAVGGVLLMSARSRAGGAVGAWVALAGGAWFLGGPPVSRLWEHAASAAGPIGAPYGGAARQMLELVGYFYGLGALIVGFAAFALGRFVSRPALVAEPPAREPAVERRQEEAPAAREREPIT